VGIGTSSPSKKLDVYLGTTGTVEQYLRNNTINLLSKIDGTTSAQFGTETSHPLVFLTGNTERARITSGGNFGVGETNPTFKLDVKTTANNIAAFESQASSYPSSSIYNAVIGRGTNIIPPSTTTTLAAGYGGGIALIVMRGDTGVADTQYTYLVTWAWNSATVLFVNTYGTNATTSTFTASAGQLQVNHNHSGACFFAVSVLTNGES
jgi:hypothetical protein